VPSYSHMTSPRNVDERNCRVYHKFKEVIGQTSLLTVFKKI